MPTPTKRVAKPSEPSPLVYVAGSRELFWQNVIREFLTSLSVLYAKAAGAPLPEGAENIFDGRLAIITSLGTRVPIGAVYPLFACGISGTDADRALSMEVECTVFQIETPEGEAFTLPLHEIRCFHSLSSQLIEQIKSASQSQQQVGEDGEEMPFGFAAFTSLARSRSASTFFPAFTGPDFPLPE